MAKESLIRNGATSVPLEMETLENLCAAGNCIKFFVAQNNTGFFNFAYLDDFRKQKSVLK